MGLARVLVIVGVASGVIGLEARDSSAQVAIESVIPPQAPRGQMTVLNVAFTGRDLVVQGAEIAPAAGITVMGVRRAVESQGVAWWEVTVEVAADAAPGERALTLVMPQGRTLPAPLVIPAHVPAIAEVQVLSAAARQPEMELRFTAQDEAADLGNAPYVWFAAGCGASEGKVGVVRGQIANGVVRARVPNPRSEEEGAGSGPCTLKLHITDAQGFESNTLQTAVD